MPTGTTSGLLLQLPLSRDEFVRAYAHLDIDEVELVSSTKVRTYLGIPFSSESSHEPMLLDFKVYQTEHF